MTTRRGGRVELRSDPVAVPIGRHHDLGREAGELLDRHVDGSPVDMGEPIEGQQLIEPDGVECLTDLVGDRVVDLAVRAGAGVDEGHRLYS